MARPTTSRRRAVTAGATVMGGMFAQAAWPAWPAWMGPARLYAATLAATHLVGSAAEVLNQTNALETLYRSTDGPNWGVDQDGNKLSTNWMVGGPCSNAWYGVTCSEEGEVTQLELDGSNVDSGIVGTLPTQLGVLTAMNKRFSECRV